MFGFLTYLTTIVFVPHILALLPFFYLLILNPKYTSYKIYQLINNPKSAISTNTFLIGLLVLVSLLNSAYNYQKIDEVSQLVPYYIFIPATFYMAKVVKPKQWNWFIILVCLEVGVAVFQYAIGIQTFFPENLHVSKSYNPDLLYYRRPNGLSVSSSTLANKLFVSLLLTFYLKYKQNTKLLIQAILFVGIALTFNRTVFAAILFFYGFRFIYNIIDVKFKPSRMFVGSVVLFVGLAAVSYVLVAYGDTIYHQLTRNKGIDVSGRDQIWAFFMDFASKNVFWGNNGYKILFNGRMHAHNSFLMVLATNGLIVSLMYMYILFRNINRNNMVFVFTLIVYSLAQYGIFWGISVMDICLFYFLVRSPGLKDDFKWKRDYSLFKLFRLSNSPAPSS
jgi:hypothetical protein